MGCVYRCLESNEMCMHCFKLTSSKCMLHFVEYHGGFIREIYVTRKAILIALGSRWLIKMTIKLWLNACAFKSIGYILQWFVYIYLMM